MSDLEPRIRADYPDLQALELEPVESGIILGGKDEASNIYVLSDEKGWSVRTLQAHEHVESSEEALAIAANLARGEVHTCQEFRGDTLAASWLEYPIDGGLKTGGVALFLNPFDRDEWRLWEDETWRRIRTSRSIDSIAHKMTTSTFELAVDEYIQCGNTFLDSVDEGLGPPAAGMKWRAGIRDKVVLQLPLGWRLVRSHEGSEDFEAEGGGPVIRASVNYRNAESRHKELIRSASRPISVDYAVLEGDAEWTQERWTLMFGEADQDILVWVELYAQRRETFPVLVRDQINSTIDKALYVALDWDFESIG